MKTITILAAALLFAGLRLASAQNLLLNPGFETGDFTGYTTTPAASGSLFGVSDALPHSGTYEAYFGGVAPGSYDTISQTFDTAGVLTLDVSFYLLEGGGSSDGFRVSVGGTNYLDLVNGGGFDYTLFSLVVPTTGDTTTLSFSGYNVPSFSRLDDITVTAGVAPEPSTWAMLSLGTVGAGVVTLRRRRAV